MRGGYYAIFMYKTQEVTPDALKRNSNNTYEAKKMQVALTFVAILAIVMLLLCGTRPTFILLAVLAAVSAVCRIVTSYILQKGTDEKNAKDTALQKKIENWRKVRRGQLRSNADNDDMFDAGGVMQDLRLSLEEGEQFFEENHEIEKLEIQISLWNRIGDAFKHLLNSCVILVCLLALSSFVAFAYSYVCRLWR